MKLPWGPGTFTTLGIMIIPVDQLKRVMVLKQELKKYKHAAEKVFNVNYFSEENEVKQTN